MARFGSKAYLAQMEDSNRKQSEYSAREATKNARLALYPDLVKALGALEEQLRLLRGIYQYTQGDDEISEQLIAQAHAVLADAEAIEKETKGMSKAKVELTGAQQELTELTDLLKRVYLTCDNGVIYPNPRGWTAWRDKDKRCPAYDGPSLLAALRVLVGEVETAGPAAPFWVRPEREPLALAPGETVEDLRHYKVAPEPLSDEARAIITGKALPQAAEAAQGWVASRESILEALEGQIGDAEGAIRRATHPNAAGYWKGAYDTLRNFERMIERGVKP